VECGNGINSKGSVMLNESMVMHVAMILVPVSTVAVMVYVTDDRRRTADYGE
jgi:hypothetical protein